jgi:signal transduction histidine kinase
MLYHKSSLNWNIVNLDYKQYPFSQIIGNKCCTFVIIDARIIIRAFLIKKIIFKNEHYTNNNFTIIAPDNNKIMKKKTICAIKAFMQRLGKILNFSAEIENFKYLDENSSVMYSILGIATISSYIVIVISSYELYEYNPVFSILSLSIGAFLITYPIWHDSLSKKFNRIFVILSLIILLYTNSFLIFSYGFSSASVISLVVNICVVGFFLDAFKSGCILFLSLCISYLYHRYKYGTILLSDDHDTTIVSFYSLFAISVVILFFLRNQQNKMQQLTNKSMYFEEFNKILEEKLLIREENLQKSLNIQTEILNNISHEIKTPMMIVMNHIELLSEEIENNNHDQNLVTLFQSLKDSVNKFYYYAGNMLDLSQYQSGRMMFDIKKTNLNILLSNIIALYDQNFGFKRSTNRQYLYLDYIYSCPKMIECDRIKIEKLITSLIDNSIQYSNDSAIRISVSESSTPLFYAGKSWDAILVEIKDRGLGIPESELDLVFEPFHLSSRTKDGSGGKGIGLALCKEIVKYHCGKIWAENNIDGNGCIIKIKLPVYYPYHEFLGKPVSGSKIMHYDDLNLQDIIQDVYATTITKK